MRIENNNTFTQGSLVLSTGKIGNVQLPDYTDFHFNTKTEPVMSDEGYRTAIIEQAKKDLAAGKFQSESAGFRNLVKSYVSAVSPDRKRMISQGLAAVFKNNNPQPKTLNLIDYLLGSVKYKKEVKNVSYAEFNDSNGEMVATYSNGGWTFYGSKAENARESELWCIYNDAWNNAARESQGSSMASTGDTTGAIDLSV
nr:hypothetical protein [uncultured Aminipila sp.]